MNASRVSTPTAGSVVAGADGSPDAKRAVLWAAEQARLEGRTLTILHAADELADLSENWLAEAGFHRSEMRRAVDQAAGEILDEATALLTDDHAGLSVETMISYDDPRTALIKAARSAHMIVVGSRGRGSFRSAVLGSVSAAVGRQAECPIVVCRPEEKPPGGGVVVGADGSAESLPVIEFAFRQASLRGMPLTVMHCVWDVAPLSAPYPVASASQAGQDQGQVVLGESVAGFRDQFPDVDVDLSLTIGLVDQRLSGASKDMDLTVVGRHHYNAWSRLIYGSMSIAVLEHAEGTVALVPEADPPVDTSDRT